MNDDIILHVDLNDEAMFPAVAIGTMDLSVLQFMMDPNKPSRQVGGPLIHVLGVNANVILQI